MSETASRGEGGEAAREPRPAGAPAVDTSYLAIDVPLSMAHSLDGAVLEGLETGRPRLLFEGRTLEGRLAQADGSLLFVPHPLSTEAASEDPERLLKVTDLVLTFPELS